MCHTSNMETTQQDGEGRFPGPTHPLRSPQVPPWLDVALLGKLSFLKKNPCFLSCNQSVDKVPHVAFGVQAEHPL